MSSSEVSLSIESGMEALTGLYLVGGPMRVTVPLEPGVTLSQYVALWSRPQWSPGHAVPTLTFLGLSFHIRAMEMSVLALLASRSDCELAVVEVEACGKP